MEHGVGMDGVVGFLLFGTVFAEAARRKMNSPLDFGKRTRRIQQQQQLVWAEWLNFTVRLSDLQSLNSPGQIEMVCAVLWMPCNAPIPISGFKMDALHKV